MNFFEKSAFLEGTIIFKNLRYDAKYLIYDQITLFLKPSGVEGNPRASSTGVGGTPEGLIFLTSGVNFFSLFLGLIEGLIEGLI